MESMTLEKALHYLNSPFLHIGQTPVSLGGIASAILVILLSFVVSALIQRSASSRLSRALKLSSGVSYVLSRFAHYFIIFCGLLLAAQCVGLNFGSLAVLFGFLSVGIGFGLQNITSNFISGIILLVERPISVDDFVSVEGQIGKVTQINMRASIIQTLDNVSIIIPNSKFIESNVINWSHRDPHIRIHCSISVAYGSDVEKVRDVLMKAASELGEILKKPSPEVRFKGFGDSALDFELLAWTDHPEKQFALQSKLNFAIDAAFREQNIHIPFPQRDLHIQMSPAVEALANNKDTSS